MVLNKNETSECASVKRRIPFVFVVTSETWNVIPIVKE